MPELSKQETMLVIDALEWGAFDGIVEYGKLASELRARFGFKSKELEDEEKRAGVDSNHSTLPKGGRSIRWRSAQCNFIALVSR